ncbi:mucin-3B-like [Coturnix japonica]|nr:mucin-3B-like [Coturnix japonica]
MGSLWGPYGVSYGVGVHLWVCPIATVSASVRMSAQVVNRNFSPELENPKSPQYIQFSIDFQDKMKELYRNVSGYEGVEILSLREGSVVVTYDVLLRVEAGNSAPSALEDRLEDLRKATATNCSGVTSELCFNGSYTTVSNYSIQPLDPALCNALVPPSLIGWYSPIPAPSGVLCVSRCHPQSERPFPCTHGACAVSSDGPHCDCSDRSSYWYLDSSCSSRVNKWGLALGLPLAAICVIATGCGAALVKARRQRRADR